jgi:hypothetical protein
MAEDLRERNEELARTLRVIRIYTQVAVGSHPPARRLYEALQQIQSDCDAALHSMEGEKK